MKTSSMFMYGLAILIVVGFFSIVLILMFVCMPQDNEKLLYMVLGGLLVQFGNIINYFFGSSKGSSDKNAIIAKLNGNDKN